MPVKSFCHKLVSFKKSDYELETRLHLDGSELALQYELKGPIKKILFDQSASAGSFVNGLWQSTCFELFMAYKETYIEWNISPTGAYACYLFSGSRHQVGEMHNAGPQDFKCVVGKSIIVSFRLKLPSWLITNSPIEYQIGGVVKTEQDIAYFAIAHSNNTPDFHNRTSFRRITYSSP